MDHKLLPQSQDAEEVLIGSIFLDPKRVFGICDDLGITPESFHVAANAVVFSEQREMYDAGKPVELTALTISMRDKGTLDVVGGAHRVTSLATSVPTAAAATHYAQILRDKWRLRQVISKCTEVIQLAYDQTNEPNSVYEFAQRALIGFTSFDDNKQEIRPIKDVVIDTLDRLEYISENPGKLKGYSYGIKGLDQKTGGLCAPDLIVVSGQTSDGKTAFAMNVVESVCIAQRIPTLVFSLEMTDSEIAERILQANAEVDLFKLRIGVSLTEKNYHDLTVSAGRLSESPLYLCDDSDLTMRQIRAKARRYKAKHGIGFIVIDYTQLVGPDDSKENRERQVANISGQAKQMAKELKSPVMILSQLNDDGKLRESRAIGMDGNVVLKLDTPDPENAPNERDLWICKQREGPRNVPVPLTFIPHFTRFVDRIKTS
jgi:replicative DNA helicase